MTVLYPNPCYNEVCYKGTVVYDTVCSETSKTCFNGHLY